MTNKEFLAKIKDGAIKSWKTHKILPSLVGAQAILESGWGKSDLATKANNLFGVKADASWKGNVFLVPTKEYINGQWVTIQANFRRYDSWNDSVNDHANFFIENDFRKNNYKGLIGEKDYKKAVASILTPKAQYGYATDPNYADKIIRVIEENNLTEWDKIAFGETPSQNTNNNTNNNGGSVTMAGQIATTHAGHGGRKNGNAWTDPGAVGSGYKEADVARQINAKIVKATGAYDATDNSGTSINGNLSNIVKKMNSVGKDWHVSNHLNSAGSLATGIEVWYWAGDETSRAKATQLSKALSDATGLPNRGAKGTRELYVLRNSNGRTLLIEWGFINNPNDMKKLIANMDKAVNALLKVFGYNTTVGGGSTAKPTPAPKPEVPSTGTGGYKFAVGTQVTFGGVFKDSVSASKANPNIGYVPASKLTKNSGKITRQLKVNNRSVYLIDNGFGWINDGDVSSVSGSGTTAAKPSTPKPTAHSKPTSGITNKNKFAKGSTVRVLKSATHYQTGQSIANFVKGSTYKVKEVKQVNQSRSQYAFLLDGINSWVLAQDLEAVGGGSGSTQKTYTVKKGDTLWGIATANKTTVANLKSWNNLKSDIIQVGQKLIVKK